MLVEVGLRAIRYAVEVGEQVRHAAGLLLRTGLALLAQIVDQRLGVHFLLDIQRRRMYDEVGPVLFVFTTPYQLRIEIAVAALVDDTDRRLGLFIHHRLMLCGRDVLAGGVLVLEGFDAQRGFWRGGFTSHWADCLRFR